MLYHGHLGLPFIPFFVLYFCFSLFFSLSRVLKICFFGLNCLTISRLSSYVKNQIFGPSRGVIFRTVSGGTPLGSRFFCFFSLFVVFFPSFHFIPFFFVSFFVFFSILGCSKLFFVGLNCIKICRISSYVKNIFFGPSREALWALFSIVSSFFFFFYLSFYLFHMFFLFFYSKMCVIGFCGNLGGWDNANPDIAASNASLNPKPQTSDT